MNDFWYNIKDFFLRKIDKKRIICYQFKQRRITWAQNAFVHANSDMSFNLNVTSFDNLSMNI